MAGLLERYDLMQNRRIGTNTMLSDGTQKGVGGAVGSQYRRQEAAYGQALRLLNRQARRGDTGSALKAIDVRNQALEGGYTPGGIRQKAQADVGIMGAITAREQAAQGLESATRTMQQDTTEKLGVQGASGVQGATRVEGASGVQGAPSRFQAATPGATPQAAIQRGTGGSNGGQWVSVGDNPVAPTESAATPSRILDRAGKRAAVLALQDKWNTQAQADAAAAAKDYSIPTPDASRFAVATPEGGAQAVGEPAVSWKDAVSNFNDAQRMLTEQKAGTQFDSLTQTPAPEPAPRESVSELNRSSALRFAQQGRPKGDISGILARVDRNVAQDKADYQTAVESLNMPENEVAKLPFNVLKYREELLKKRKS